MKVGLPFHSLGRNRRSTQWCVSAPGDISGSRSDGPQAPHPLNFHLAGPPAQQGVSFGAAPHSPMNSQKQHKRSLALDIAKENNRAETGDAGEEPNAPSLGFLPEPSSTDNLDKSTPAAAHCAKRRKTTAIPKPIRTSVSEGPIPYPNSSETTARRRGVSVEHFSDCTSVNVVRTRVCQQARSGVQNSVSSSTVLAPEIERDPITTPVEAPIAQKIDMAMSVTEEVSAFSNHGSFPGQMKAVQALRRQGFDTPPTCTPDSPSVINVSSLPPVSSRHNAAVFGSTTFDGHGRNRSESPENPPHLSPANGNSEIVSTAGAPSSSRLCDESHEAGGVGENPVPRTPAGSNTVAHPDVSEITSPADTASGQSRHWSKGSHIRSTGGSPSSSHMPVQPREPKARKTVNSDRRSRKASSSGKQVKDKPKLITPLEYAQKLQSSLDLHVKLKTNYLKGKRIFYVGGDMLYASSTTRGRMEYIVKHGGTLVPRYDPATVTHVVTDTGVRPTLRALSLKSLSDIPDDIPTVTWGWVVSGYKRARNRQSKISLKDGDSGDENILDFEFMHAAFSERIDAGRSWKNVRRGKQAVRDIALRADSADDRSGDISQISTFSQESELARTEGHGVSHTALPPPPLDFRLADGRRADGNAHSGEGEKASGNEDPLSEYYAQARADREAQWNRDASDSDDGDDDFDYHSRPAPRRGFMCDIKGYKATDCVNQHIVDKLEELRELHKAKSSEDDRWRAYSYGKCIPALRNYPKQIRSFSEARSIRGVGEKTALKIMEIINTGDLKRITYGNTEDVAAARVFQGIYGAVILPLLGLRVVSERWMMSELGKAG
ncbi:hypothetical protein J3R82DRAFT_8560 [Butyriboletus roseoflavus]|nr:hypothetical protein J3R82DRAFT_8560 [Butyriboletus roseoflavus]